MAGDLQVVYEKVCDEKHKAIKERLDTDNNRLNEHSKRMDTIEEAVIKLTMLVEDAKKKSVFDKILIVSLFIMVVVIAAMVLGPTITGKILGGAI